MSETQEQDAQLDPDYQEELENAGPSTSEAPNTPVISDEVPPVEAPKAGEVVEEAPSEYDEYSVTELKAETDHRGLAVERGDGEQGEPLKEDYIKALEADDAKE